MKKSFGSKHSNKEKKKPAKEVPQPQTWEEYLEGERYGTGEKAKRYYERAGDMYNKACKLNPEDSDCLYNFGRILYILVDFTHSPCQKLSLLNASIESFRSALVYDSDNADTLFNLAQALTTHAEVIQDHSEDDEEHDHEHKRSDNDLFHGTPEERAALGLQEAIQLFERCYIIQQRALYATLKETQPKKGESLDDMPKEELDELKEELTNSAGVLIDTLISTSQALTSLAFLVDAMDRSKEYYKQAGEKLEIALGVATDKHLWPAKKEEDGKGKGKGKQLSSSSSIDSTETEDVQPARKPVAVFREAESHEGISQEEKVCDIHLQYSNLLSSQSDRHFQDTGRISEKLYQASLYHLDAVLSVQPRHVEALCDKGDLLGAWAQGLAAFEGPVAGLSDIERWDSGSNITLGNSESVAAEGAAESQKPTRANRIWQLFASATRAFLSALEVESQNPSILEKLGDIHWSRSLLTSPVTLKNRPMLLNNASVYYRFAWESCRDASPDSVDEEQRLEILLSWAQVLRAIPGKEEEVLRVLKQWKRCGGSKEMLTDMLEGQSGDILQEDFIEFALKQFRKL
ncbi:hypothetical protein BGZ94_001771 [Podila epigama]|nr:hypothetical protein BGZ94_001771 [Podila epigama]